MRWETETCLALTRKRVDAPHARAGTGTTTGLISQAGAGWMKGDRATWAQHRQRVPHPHREGGGGGEGGGAGEGEGGRGSELLFH